jgi:hypothetical protein
MVIAIVIPILLTIGVLTTVIIMITMLVQRFWNKHRSQPIISIRYSEIQVSIIAICMLTEKHACMCFSHSCMI